MITKQVVTLAVCTISPPVMAQIPVGPFDVTSNLGVQVEHDSNVNAVENDAIAVERLLLNAAVQVSFDNSVSQFLLTYALEDENDNSEDIENYLDQILSLDAGVLLSESHQLSLAVSRLQTHAPRGQDSPSGINSISLDEYDDNTAELGYQGRIFGSAFDLELSLSEQEIRYTTNREQTAELDLDESGRNIALYWNLAQEIRLGLNHEFTETRYLVDASADSDEVIRSIEITYNPGTRLSFGARFGEIETERIDSNEITKEDYWDVEVAWFFFSYSSITLSSSNRVQQSTSSLTATGERVVTELNGISWTHNWTDLFATNIGITHSVDSFPDSDRGDIEDSTYSLDFGYKLRRWLDLSIFMEVEERNSNEPDVEEYERDRYGLSVTMTL